MENSPTSPYRDDIVISWPELHRDTRLLCHQLLQKGPFKGIIAITRGGLIPAALVARELEIRLVDTICASSYEAADDDTAHTLMSYTHEGGPYSDYAPFDVAALMASRARLVSQSWARSSSRTAPRIRMRAYHSKVGPVSPPFFRSESTRPKMPAANKSSRWTFAGTRRAIGATT
mgnify:CR=1 FL=1